MKKKASLVFLACSFVCVSFAGDNQNKGVTPLANAKPVSAAVPLLKIPIIKANLTQLLNKTISVQAEYGFHKNMSVALGGTIMIPSSVPNVFVSEFKIDNAIPQFNGFTVTPEFRYYPGKKVLHKAPHGFYIAPYMRYAKYGVESSITDENDLQVNLETTIRGTTYGVMLGNQWLIGDHFTIDWWIVGGGYGNSTFDVSGTTASGVSLTSQQQDYFADEIESTLTTVLDDIPSAIKGNAKVSETTVSNNSIASGIENLQMISLRGLGFSIGFRF